MEKGTRLEIQWLRLFASTIEGMGSTPGWETKIPYDTRWGQKKNTKNVKTKLRDGKGYKEIPLFVREKMSLISHILILRYLGNTPTRRPYHLLV